MTCPCVCPWRTSPPSPRAPSASDKASSRIDFPAPVSPVKTDRPSLKSRSSLSMRTMSRIASWTSIAPRDQLLPMTVRVKPRNARLIQDC